MSKKKDSWFIGWTAILCAAVLGAVGSVVGGPVAACIGAGVGGALGWVITEGKKGDKRPLINSEVQHL